MLHRLARRVRADGSWCSTPSPASPTPEPERDGVGHLPRPRPAQGPRHHERDDHPDPRRRQESSEVDVSSLVDTWLLLRNDESNGERNRLLFVIKSRGSAHSNQVREFVLTDDGAELLDVYVGPNGVLTGSERVEQIGQEKLAQAPEPTRPSAAARSWSSDPPRSEAEMAALQAQLTADTAEFERFEASADAGRASGVAVRALAGPRALGRPRRTPRDDRSLRTSRTRSTPGNAADGAAMFDLRLYVAGQSPRSVRALENLRRSATSTSPAATGSRSSTCWSTRRSRGATRSSPYPRWCASSPSRSARSSGTSPTPTGCSWASRCGHWAASCRDRRGLGPSLGADALRQRRVAALGRGDRDRAPDLRRGPRRRCRPRRGQRDRASRPGRCATASSRCPRSSSAPPTRAASSSGT